MYIIAIDPGNEQSAYCIMEGCRPRQFGKVDNDALRELLINETRVSHYSAVVIEKVASYGMAVGQEVFDTCIWIGRFTEAAQCRVEYVYRMDEKIAICHDSKARDSNIRQALIDRFAAFDKKNGKGTKKNHDWFYGFKADIWSSYAVGITWLEKEKERILQRDPSRGGMPADCGGDLDGVREASGADA